MKLTFYLISPDRKIKPGSIFSLAQNMEDYIFKHMTEVQFYSIIMVDEKGKQVGEMTVKRYLELKNEGNSTGQNN